MHGISLSDFTKMIWGVGVFTRFSIELKDEDGKPHKVHLVANLRIDGKRCWAYHFCRGTNCIGSSNKG
jgi:hypothetical protein